MKCSIALVNTCKNPDLARIHNDYIFSLIEGHWGTPLRIATNFSSAVKADFMLWIGDSPFDIPREECSRTFALDITHSNVLEFLEARPLLGVVDGRKFNSNSPMIYARNGIWENAGFQKFRNLNEEYTIVGRGDLDALFPCILAYLCAAHDLGDSLMDLFKRK